MSNKILTRHLWIEPHHLKLKLKLYRDFFCWWGCTKTIIVQTIHLPKFNLNFLAKICFCHFRCLSKYHLTVFGQMIMNQIIVNFYTIILQHFVNKLLPNRPPCSPDLALPDYFLLPKVNSALKGNFIHIMESVN